MIPQEKHKTHMSSKRAMTFCVLLGSQNQIVKSFFLKLYVLAFCINASTFSLIRDLVGSMTAAFIACKWHIEKHGTDSLLVES